MIRRSLQVAAALIAQLAMSVTYAVLTRNLRRENEQMHLAIDSMAQGLCMFDASERLVVCNKQYHEMYELGADDVRPGSTLSEVLARRVAKGTFNHDPHQYRKDFVSAVRQDTEGASWFKRATAGAFYRLINRFGETEIVPGAADFCLLSARAHARAQREAPARARRRHGLHDRHPAAQRRRHDLHR